MGECRFGLHPRASLLISVNLRFRFPGRAGGAGQCVNSQGLAVQRRSSVAREDAAGHRRGENNSSTRVPAAVPSQDVEFMPMGRRRERASNSLRVSNRYGAGRPLRVDRPVLRRRKCPAAAIRAITQPARPADPHLRPLQSSPPANPTASAWAMPQPIATTCVEPRLLPRSSLPRHGAHEARIGRAVGQFRDLELHHAGRENAGCARSFR